MKKIKLMRPKKSAIKKEIYLFSPTIKITPHAKVIFLNIVVTDNVI